MNPNTLLQRYMSSHNTSVGAYTFYYIRLIQLLHFIYMDRVNCDDIGVELNQLAPKDIAAWLLQDYEHTMDNGNASEMIEKLLELFFIPAATSPEDLEPLFVPHLPEPYVLTDREILALYLLVHDDRVFPFLSEKVRGKLQTALQQHPYASAFQTIQENFQLTRPDTIDNPHVVSTVTTLFQAIVQGNNTLEVTTADDTYVVTPCHLRYFANTQEYHLLGLTSESQYIYLPVQTIQTLTTLEEAPIADRYSVLERLLQADAQTLQLRITNDRNALRRTFHALADYTKETTLVETILDDEEELQDHTYQITITYYPFDEEDVYQKILSLSAMVTVISPLSIRERVVQHFQSLLENLGVPR